MKLKTHPRAAEIVNTLAHKYIAVRSAEETSRANSALEALDQELENQGDLIQAIRDDLASPTPTHSAEELTQEIALLSQMKDQQEEQRVLLRKPRTPATISELAN